MSRAEPQPHILIVDDIPAISKIAGLVLEKTNKYRISYAISGTVALRRILEDTPDLVLLDIDMPKMGGHEVCQRLKQSPIYCDIPIIFLTAMDSTSDTVSGFRLGGADYITKPFVPAILLARVETHLNLFLSQRREKALKQHLQNILSSMNEGLAVINAENIIQEINPKLQALSGKQASELIGHPFSSLFSDEGDEQQLLSDRKLQPLNGAEIPVRILGSSLSSSKEENDIEDGSRVLLIHDLRELLSAESSRQASHAKDNFLASMSHELRTPLASIIGNSELLLQRLNNTKERELAQQIEVAGRNQLALIRDILEVSKIEEGNITIDEAPYDLSTLLSEIKQLFSHQVEQAGLTLKVSEKEMPNHQLLGDAGHIKQVLHNLMSNAVKFTEQGSIQITAWSTTQQLHITIEDSGIGISPEIMETLFQRFQQADSSISRRFGGGGLGLYIANNLTRLMGGSIEAHSTEQKGSTFQLNLPCKLSDLPAYARNTEASSTLPRNQAHHFRGRVLVAEDTPEMWMLIESILQSMGIETTIAKNGQEALELALANPFDLILMDMQMPIMDGIEATTMLRQVGYVQPIAALTANVTQKHQEQFEQAGCDAFLNKPVDQQALLAVLRCHLQPAEEGDAALHSEVEELVISDELRQIFMDRLTTMVPSLKSALRYEQWDEVRSIAHNIKGSGSSFGYPELTVMGKEVCDAIDYEQLEQVTELTTPLLERMKQVLD